MMELKIKRTFKSAPMYDFLFSEPVNKGFGKEKFLYDQCTTN